MYEVVLDSDGGRHLVLRRLAPPNPDVSFEATLVTPEGQMTLPVYGYRSSMGPFFADLAAAWKGFEGVKTYSSLEGELTLSCTHDGMGALSCKATLRRSSPPSWSLDVELTWGAGSHVDRLSADIEAFFSLDPSIHRSTD